MSTFTVPTTSSLKTVTLQTLMPPDETGFGGAVIVTAQKSPTSLQTGSAGSFGSHFFWMSWKQCGPVAVRVLRHVPWPKTAQIWSPVTPDAAASRTPHDECGASEQLGPTLQRPDPSQS